MNKCCGLLGAFCLALGLAGCVMPAVEYKIPEAVERPSSDQPTTGKARTSSKIHAELAAAYLEALRLGIALDEANKAVAVDSSYAMGHLIKAQVYAELGQFGLAAPEFEEAARLAPGDPVINNAYGWYLCSQKQESQGLQRLDMAARNPYYATPAKAWTNAGLCYLRQKNDVLAESSFEHAFALDDHEPMPLFHLANINLRNGRYLRAKQWFDQLMNKRDPGVEVLWLGIRIEQKLGNADTVKQYAERLRTDFPSSVEYQNYLQGKFE